MTFQGFGKDTVKFLRGLGKNNTKEWFDAHRDEYDTHYIAPAKAFVGAMSGPLQKLDPAVQADPRVNKSIFRVNRDIRFSKDKTPYKDHLDCWFWNGDRKTGSGFYFRLTAKEVLLGAGLHGLDKDGLAKFRAAVHDDARGAQLQKLISKCEKAGFMVEGAKYKRVPRGYDAEHPRAALLKHGSLGVMLKAKHPPELGDKSFVRWCAKHWKAMAPVHLWMAETLA